MTLQRFLNGVGDFLLSRPVLRRLRPGASEPLPWGTVLVLALLGPLLGALAGLAMMGLMQGTPMRGSGWPVRWLAAAGVVLGVFDALLLAVAWDRRAARLRALGRTEPEPVPPRRWWQTLGVGPFYALGVLVLTPGFLCFAIHNALGTREWQRAHAAMVARGEPLTVAQLLGTPPADEENFAATPLLRPLLDYRLVVTNGVQDFVWADAAARYRVDAIGIPLPIAAAGTPKGGSKEPRIHDARLKLEDYARGIRAMPVRQIQHPILPELAARYGVSTSAVPALDREKASALVITNAAAEVLEYLRRFEPEFAELERAAARPRSRFPVHWDEVMSVQMAHLSTGKKLSTLFRVRAAARLAVGDAAGALADTHTLLRMGGMLSEEPMLISKLVQIAQVAIGIGGVWEGLAARKWDEAQIAGLQAAVARIDLRDAMVAGLRGERRIGNAWYDGMLGGAAPGVSGGGGSPDSALLMPDLRISPGFLVPHGLFRMNQVNNNRVIDALIDEVRSPEWPASCTRQITSDARLKALGLHPLTPYGILPSMLLPALDKAHPKAARQNVTARLAEIACALERFRLRHGGYPEGLDPLTPEFMDTVPADPMNRKPFGYRRTEEGHFRLWSVGMNGRDDGGVMMTPDKNDREGDWVWPGMVPGPEPTLF